jgi:hypothetical protein
MSRFKDYKYDDITMMYIPEEDRRFLPHFACGTLPIVYPFQPVAKRTRSEVAKLKKHIKLYKYDLPALSRLQKAACAERLRVCAVNGATCPPSVVPLRPRTFANRLNREP